MNVLLKDDKSFLFIRLDTSHQWPRLSLVRNRKNRGEHFGPYPNASTARRAKHLVQKLCQLRDCSDSTLANRARPCLKFGIKLCLAPCVAKCDAEEYSQALGNTRDILNGNVAPLLASERQAMARHSQEMAYENALRCRDNIKALESLQQKQNVRLVSGKDFDVVAIDVRGAYAVLQYRDGDWLHSTTGFVPLFDDLQNAMSKLLIALYADGADVPPEVLIDIEPRDLNQIQDAVCSKTNSKFELLIPQRGQKRALVKMAQRNAQSLKGEQRVLSYSSVARTICSLFGVPAPHIVDCIDVSHLQGNQCVASKVRFVDGQPEQSSYRHYLIAGGTGNDDFAAMREVVSRVLARRATEGLPDLLILDGGAQQLASGQQILEREQVDLPLLSLAKSRSSKIGIQAEERVFMTRREQPVVLPRGTDIRHFFERIRNEAHRFAISHHRRRRESLRLVLEKIPQIGMRRRQVLLDYCGGDLSILANAQIDDLTALKGINAELAHNVQNYLRRELGSG
jgi:excinuclease ABC subunit C